MLESSDCRAESSRWGTRIFEFRDLARGFRGERYALYVFADMRRGSDLNYGRRIGVSFCMLLQLQATLF